MAELECVYWIAMVAPALTPTPIVDRLNHDIVDIMKTTAMREFLLAQGPNRLRIADAAFQAN
jgi:hypothetical protein